ncbi:MAG: helix-turn-helix domain-containing protein [Nocardioidaceae bacterium]|nr:helix-turn-helix domain-containing protein [Nocardioidaceae bacterium]
MTYPTVSTAVAGEVRAQLARLNQSGIWLSEMTHIPHPTLRRRLAGDGNLTIDELAKIARALGVSMASLLPRTEDAA